MSGRPVTVSSLLSEDLEGEDDGRDAHGDVDPEDPAPRQFDEEATDHGTECRAERADRRPGTDRLRALGTGHGGEQQRQ